MTMSSGDVERNQSEMRPSIFLRTQRQKAYVGKFPFRAFSRRVSYRAQDAIQILKDAFAESARGMPNKMSSLYRASAVKSSLVISRSGNTEKRTKNFTFSDCDRNLKNSGTTKGSTGRGRASNDIRFKASPAADESSE